MLKKVLLMAGAGASLLAMPTTASAQATDPYIGEMITVGFGFCPRNWAEANGALIPIAQNNALFALIGTTYGGDGVTTFALPDLRGRAIINQGQGPGLPFRSLGETAGATSVTLTSSNLPSHTHTSALRAQSAGGNSTSPSVSIARTSGPQTIYSTVAPTDAMNAASISVQPTGGGQAVNKTSPRLAMTQCIALFGIFPSFN